MICIERKLCLMCIVQILLCEFDKWFEEFPFCMLQLILCVECMLLAVYYLRQKSLRLRRSQCAVRRDGNCTLFRIKSFSDSEPDLGDGKLASFYVI